MTTASRQRPAAITLTEAFRFKVGTIKLIGICAPAMLVVSYPG